MATGQEELGPRDRAILEALRPYPEGRNLDQTYRAVASVMAKGTLRDQLAILVERGMLEVTRESRNQTVYRIINEGVTAFNDYWARQFGILDERISRISDRFRELGSTEERETHLFLGLLEFLEEFDFMILRAMWVYVEEGRRVSVFERFTGFEKALWESYDYLFERYLTVCQMTRPEFEDTYYMLSRFRKAQNIDAFKRWDEIMVVEKKVQDFRPVKPRSELDEVMKKNPKEIVEYFKRVVDSKLPAPSARPEVSSRGGKGRGTR